ncbi:MAG: hypothetical protein GY777_29795, partial [Candidatus Brocadiaceae bacterium]|nr:hypothetical protein [Candidatus Brocadiaceae bacterium]
MIKKISIITILTISLVFASFMIQKRRAEAVVPLAVYVAVTALIHFAVGAYIYLNSQSGINTETHKITNINPTTGKIDIEYLEDTKVGSTDQTPAHRVDEIGANEILNVYPEYASKGLSTGQGCNANFLWDQWSTQVVNSVDSLYDGDHIEYFQVNYGYWPAGNCTLMGAGAVMLDSSSNHVESSYDANGGVLGGSYTGTFGSEEVQMYEFIDDVPLLPDCFDGIQNQDETGIDCGGVCEMNFGFVCPPVETCADDIMNQDETGIDYGGVCGTDDPVAAPAENFTDTNQDGVDDLSGLDATGSITVASP